MGVNAFLKRAVGRVAPSRLVVRAGETGGVHLTFDDGPHLHNTPAILEILRHARVPATFFVQGTEVSKAPDLVRAIAAEGHVVGNHGFRHLHWKSQPTAAFLEDVETTQGLITELVGAAQPMLYRPPYGEITARAVLALWRRGYRIVLWSVDSRDSFAGSPEAIVRRLDGTRLRGGDVILLHDDGAHTVAALPVLIDRIRRRGLAFRPIPEVPRERGR